MTKGLIVARAPVAPALDSFAFFPAAMLGVGHELHILVREDRYGIVPLDPVHKLVARYGKHFGNAPGGRNVWVLDFRFGSLPRPCQRATASLGPLLVRERLEVSLVDTSSQI